MNHLEKYPMFFAGAVSDHGFVPFFKEIYNAKDGWQVYIIKGGPGSGKSSFMRKIAADRGNEDTFLISCSSDPDSLDGVVFTREKICIFDGTAPHILEAEYPGMCENLLDFGALWDAEMLREHAKDKISAFEKNAAFHKRAARYLAAAGMVLRDNRKIFTEATDLQKVYKFAAGFAKREIEKPEKNVPGKNMNLLLSAVTPKGHLFFEDSIHKLCSRTVAIEEENSSAAGVILEVMKNRALSFGYDVISCLDPITPDKKLDHILIPSLGLAVCSSNAYHPVAVADKRIHCRRFTDNDFITSKKQKIAFNKRVIKELMASTTATLAEAKQAHDLMELFYMEAMDFGKLNEKCADFSQQLKKFF